MSEAGPKHIEGSRSTLSFSTLSSRPKGSSQAAVCFKIDKAQRHQYSAFDVPSVYYSGRAEFYISPAAEL
jgi:hypothetical protein